MTAPQQTDAGERRSRLPVVIGVAVAIAVAAFVAIYLLFFSGDSPDELRLSTPGTTAAGGPSTTAAAASGSGGATGAAPASLEGAWTVDEGSVAGYRVREKLARLPAQSDAVGRTGEITGSIEVDRQGEQLVVAEGARFEVDVSTLRSDESRRDDRIRTMGLESNRFPTATFVSTAPIRLPAGTETGQPVETEVTGNLTIHGVTNRVTIPLEAQLTGGRIEVVGSYTFPFREFGMSPPNVAGFVTVEDEATLEFQLFFDKG